MILLNVLEIDFIRIKFLIAWFITDKCDFLIPMKFNKNNANIQILTIITSKRQLSIVKSYFPISKSDQSTNRK